MEQNIDIGKKDIIMVSIIVPIYNVSLYISDCLRSIYEQTYPYLEVILVNDATPDDSMEQAAPWIEKLREKFEVKVVTHSQNRGLSAARNTGIRTSTTNWVYFLDSDDEIVPFCIELLVGQVELYPNVDFVIGGVKVVGSNWKYPLTCQPYVDNNKEILQDYVNGKWYVMAVNHLYRKEYLLQNDLFFKEGIYHEDMLYSFQIAMTAQTMAVVCLDTYIYKVRSVGSITSHRKRKNFEDLILINSEKIETILQKYNVGDFSIPFTYCLDIVYEFECCLVENKVLSWGVKKYFVDCMKKEYNTVKPYKNGVLNVKYKLLYIMQTFHPLLICIFVRLRLLLSK